MEKTLNIYCDGACSGNHQKDASLRKIGWGIVLEYNGKEKEISGAEPGGSNNVAELKAVIVALQALKPEYTGKIVITTDSNYVGDAFRKKWLDDWQKRGWRTSSKKPVVNKELWVELLALLEGKNYEFCWIEGHAGHPQNERCDKLATQAILNLAPKQELCPACNYQPGYEIEYAHCAKCCALDK